MGNGCPVPGAMPQAKLCHSFGVKAALAVAELAQPRAVPLGLRGFGVHLRVRTECLDRLDEPRPPLLGRVPPLLRDPLVTLLDLSGGRPGDLDPERHGFFPSESRNFRAGSVLPFSMSSRLLLRNAAISAF